MNDPNNCQHKNYRIFSAMRTTEMRYCVDCHTMIFVPITPRPPEQNMISAAWNEDKEDSDAPHEL